MTPVASPCINHCQMDPERGLCRGCWRTLDEIAAWSRLDGTARRLVLATIDQRRRSAGETPTGQQQP